MALRSTSALVFVPPRIISISLVLLVFFGLRTLAVLCRRLLVFFLFIFDVVVFFYFILFDSARLVIIYLLTTYCFLISGILFDGWKTQFFALLLCVHIHCVRSCFYGQ